jgi:hypothetical protein
MVTREELEAREDVQEILALLKSEPKVAGKDLCPISTPIGIVVVTNPTGGQWNIARAQIWDDDASVKSKAIAGLFRSLLVYPPADVLKDKLTHKPAALDGGSVMKQFNVHIGLVEADEVK